MLHPSLSDLRITELVDLISSSRISPGAGAAGGVALALGAACAAKAVEISLKHSPHDAHLAAGLPRLQKVRGFALQGADIDSQAFADFITHRSASGATELVDTGEAMAHLIAALFTIIKDVEPYVRSSMAGDLLAAKSLATAARTIQSANEVEAKRARRSMGEEGEL
jgi:hypothetical protein